MDDVTSKFVWLEVDAMISKFVWVEVDAITLKFVYQNSFSCVWMQQCVWVQQEDVPCLGTMCHQPHPSNDRFVSVGQVSPSKMQAQCGGGLVFCLAFCLEKFHKCASLPSHGTTVLCLGGCGGGP